MNDFDENLIIKYVPKDKQEKALKKLQTGYPVQYIIGNVSFLGLEIDVNENVLIPRFETEYLVSAVLKMLDKYNLKKPNILDIGTGSGCIAIAIKKNYDCEMNALDISLPAIKVAKANAKKNNTSVNFICESIMDYKTNKKYDVIISNPPYVAVDSKIDEKIKYEPQDAIFAPDNGLYFYKIILEKAVKMVKKRSLIAFEIGDNQGKAIEKIAKEYFPDAKIVIKKDLNHYDRYFYIINE